MWLKPAGATVFELVILEGLTTKVLSNSTDPPNSLYTKDLFEPHPVIPDAWKYVGRQDDRITLSNGENVLLLPIEGRIKKDPLVREAVVFGIGKPVPGVLVFCNNLATGTSDLEFIPQVWPVIEKANQQAESFSQIRRSMMVVLGANTDYPRTDKGSIIRTRVYEAFAEQIESAYAQLDVMKGNNLHLNLNQMEEYLLNLCNERLHRAIDDHKTDLFSAGLDSLRAIHMTSTMKREIFLGVHAISFGPQTIYRNANVKRLAQYLCNRTIDDRLEGRTQIKLMEELIAKYSALRPHFPVHQAPAPGRNTIVRNSSLTLSFESVH